MGILAKRMNVFSGCWISCLVLGASLATAGGCAAGPVYVPSAQATPIADGTYTAAQADRGKLMYEQHCTTCHGSSLRGGANEFAAPALAGPFFFETWSGRPVEELFRYTTENMPPDQPRLSDAAYLDLTAYVLQVLGYPVGSAELTADAPFMRRGIERQP